MDINKFCPFFILLESFGSLDKKCNIFDFATYGCRHRFATCLLAKFDESLEHFEHKCL